MTKKRTPYLDDEERAALTTALIRLGFDTATARHLVIVAGRIPAVAAPGSRRQS